MNTFRFKKELFKNEVKVMQLIQNENGVTLHDFLKEENNFYILMEYCTSNLKDYLDMRNSQLIYKEVKTKYSWQSFGEK